MGCSHREAGACGSGLMSSSESSESQNQNTGDDYWGLGNWGRGDALGCKISHEKFPEVCFTTRWVSPTLANYTLKMVKPGNLTVCDFKKKK